MPTVDKELVWPLRGLVRQFSYQQSSEASTVDCSNVWPQSADEERLRGGSRPGTKKAYTTQLGESSIPLSGVGVGDLIRFVGGNNNRIGRIVTSMAGGVISWGDPLGASLKIGDSLIVHDTPGITYTVNNLYPPLMQAMTCSGSNTGDDVSGIDHTAALKDEDT